MRKAVHSCAVAADGAGGMGAHQVEMFRGSQSRPAQRQANALGLPLRMRHDEIMGVAVDRVAHHSP